MTAAYFNKVFQCEGIDRVVNLYCPAFKYETQSFIVEHSRSQIFARTAGAAGWRTACPKWQSRDGETLQATDFLLKHSGTLIAFQPRSTCPARSLSVAQSEDMCRALTRLGTVFYVDCIPPRHPLPPGCIALSGLVWPVVAAVVARTNLVVAVDSALIHLAAALDVPCLGLFGPTGGRAVAASYPKTVVLDGASLDCPSPCHYTAARGWDKLRCRTNGCGRLLSLSSGKVAAVADQLLRKCL